MHNFKNRGFNNDLDSKSLVVNSAFLGGEPRGKFDIYAGVWTHGGRALEDMIQVEGVDDSHKTIRNLPGFSSGLGRVNGEMAAIVHDNEAILPAHQAETLREMGVIEGDGRYPTLNTSPLVSTATTSSNHSTSQTIENTFHISINGGNTNRETGSAVREAMEEFFAELNIMMPVTREG